ncbi:glycosyltransferase [Motilimonas eburnea]|uniref:glycosyltransferase n=1 Tax=Motilimonas eburnea TaxID=1737488 RepID=UPI001E2F4038|nr:glycosyltransferase [Motilimonas eburnea]MCE2570751.1 glycosyltransferase [Motilimonas eburnea]
MTRSMLVFGEDWGGLPSSSQHLIKGLVQQYHTRVNWVNSIGLRQPRVSIRDLKRVISKLASKGSAQVPLAETTPQTNQAKPFKVLAPKAWPAPQHHWARAIASQMLAKQLAAYSADIIFTALPTAIDTINQLPHQALVYYAGDDFGALAGVDHTTVLAREHTLLQQADLVIAASNALADLLHSRAPQQKNIQVLPHGVDLELFQSAAPPAAELGSGHLVAGFYGSLSEWLNQPLLVEVMHALPHWQFVFIGKIETDISMLLAMPNFVHLGAKPHHQLPRYSQHWHASLLPFVDNPQIQACNPLKLREYLAAGRPVLSTYFPALEEYRDSVHLVQNSQDLVQHLRAIEQNQPRIQLACRLGLQQVQQQSWHHRVTQLATWLERL